MRVLACVQARMSSRRFPGKMLAPFRGRPLIHSVIESVRAAVPGAQVVLVTSVDATDDPLAWYTSQACRVSVFRGPLDDVLGRFQQCSALYPSDWVLRICGDSPVMSPDVVKLVLEQAQVNPTADLITTTLKRTFPKGQSPELIKTSSLHALAAEPLSAGDREHVTQFFHQNAQRFHVVGVSCSDETLTQINLAIDTLEDLRSVEALDLNDVQKQIADACKTPEDNNKNKPILVNTQTESLDAQTPINTLSAAVVGLGVGEQHAIALAKSPGVRLRWVYDFDESKMQRVAKELNSQCAINYQQILDDKSVDLVSLATNDDDHAEQTVAALRAGKHVFVEKPLARTVDEVAKIRNAWLSSKRQLGSNLILRSAPLYRWLKELIESGEMGEIYSVDGDYLYGRLHKITEGWRKNVENYSVMEGGGVHMVDLMMWLTNQQPTHVSCVGSQIATKGTAFRYNDFSSATFRFASGMVGRITANFGCVHRHQHVLRVFGTKATLLYDDQGPRLHRTRDPSQASEPLGQSPLPASKGELVAPFAQQLLQGSIEQSNAEHEFAVITACIAADQALAAAHEVPIEYP